MFRTLACAVVVPAILLSFAGCSSPEEGPVCNEDPICGCYGIYNDLMQICECSPGYAGTFCNECAPGYTGYPDCVPESGNTEGIPDYYGNDNYVPPTDGDTPVYDDGAVIPDDNSCDAIQCNGHGKCQQDGSCKCYQGYAGTACDECAPGFTGYPDCYFKMCEPDMRTCKNETTVQQCDSAGKEWIEVETCDTGEECYEGECLTECGRAEKEESYVGCEYWGAFLPNLMEYEGGNYAIVVANPNDTDVTVTVYTSGDIQIAQFSVAPGQINSYTFNQTYHLIGAGITNLAFKFVASRPVTMTQMNPFGNVLIYTNDATLLLPKGALGMKNMAMSWPTWKNDYPGYISVIATEPGLTSVMVIYGGYSKAGNGVNAQTPGDSVTYTLNQYQILTLNSAPGGSYGADITGSYIEADKKIAVFGGHQCTYVPADTPACDHLEHQMFPLRSWGKEYVVVRTRPRGNENDNIRFLASEANTTINWTGGLSGSVVLQAGQHYDIWTSTDFVVTADKPIMVGQILASQDAGAGTGDPAMMLIAPNEQFRKDYIFLVAPNYDYDRLTLVAPADTDITFDGTSMNSNSFTPIPGSMWYRQYLDTNDGVHKITANKPVGLYVYGFSQYVSYAYTAGLDLLKINDVE